MHKTGNLIPILLIYRSSLQFFKQVRHRYNIVTSRQNGNDIKQKDDIISTLKSDHRTTSKDSSRTV